MKQEKVFVKYKHFNDNSSNPREREPRKPPDRKKYAEKTHRHREIARQMMEAFAPAAQPTAVVAALIQKHPKIFTLESHAPEKDLNDTLNEFVIVNARKYLQSLQHRREQDADSEEEPDWNSDEDFDPSMESKSIETTIVQKVVERMGDNYSKRKDELKRHEKEFLEAYFRDKKKEQEEDAHAPPRPPSPPQTNGNHVEKKEEKAADSNIWSEYQEKQVTNYVDLGYMTKIDNEDEEIQAELAEDNDMFCSDESGDEAAKSDSDESGEDDIFGDEHPTTRMAKAESQVENEESPKATAKGTVFINDRIFSKIADEVGLQAGRCQWILSNENSKFRVSTEYMDTIYRKEKMHEILPLIALNHSEFLHNDQVETARGLEVFRNYNARKYPGQARPRIHFKEKNYSHLKKK